MPCLCYTWGMLKAIIWDFDGVIVDSESLHYRAFAQISRRLDVELTWEEYVERYIGYDDRDVFRLLLTAGAKANDDSRQVETLCAQKAELFEQMVVEGIQPMPGAVELIGNAARQMPLGISSGATQRDIALILGRLGLLDEFKVIVAADNVARSKPDPQSYVLAVSGLSQLRPELALEPGDCLAIEDTAAGIESARAAGLMTLGLTSTGSAELLHRAHRIVDTLEGLGVEQLQAWFGG